MPRPAITFDAGSPVADTPLLTVVADNDSFGEADGLGSGERFDPSALIVEDTAPVAPEAPVEVVSEEDDMADAAEIARQLANLSPKAAKAVAAAAKATTTEEREAARWPRSTRPRIRSTAVSCSSSSARSTADPSTTVPVPPAPDGAGGPTPVGCPAASAMISPCGDRIPGSGGRDRYRARP